MKSPVLSILFLLLILSFFTGCRKNTVPDKLKELDFTVVSGTDVPPELQELIDQRCDKAFQMTYTDGSFLYIVKGYGEQETDGYSITVKNLYQAEDSLVFDTDLIGPRKNESVSQQTTFPYIIVKTEYRDLPVIFPSTDTNPSVSADRSDPQK